MERNDPRPVPARRAEGPTWLATEAVVAGRLLVIGVAVLALGWLLGQVQVVAVAAFLSFALAAMLWPATRILGRFLPSAVAAILSVASLVAVLAALVWFVGARVVDSLPQLQASVTTGLQSLDRWAQSRNLTTSGNLLDQAVDLAQRRADELFASVSTLAQNGLGALSTAATLAVVTVFGTIFALTGGRDLLRTVVGWSPAARRTELDGGIRAAFTTARWWMWASTLTGLVDGVFIGLGLWAMGVPLAVPIGALTFVLGFIPMLGATFAGAVAVGVALVSGGLDTALLALLLVLAVQQIEGNVLSPLLMSRAMSFPPLVTLLLSTAGGVALGLVGVFLAVPLAGVVVAFRRGWVDASAAAPGGATRRDPDEIAAGDADDHPRATPETA